MRSKIKGVFEHTFNLVEKESTPVKLSKKKLFFVYLFLVQSNCFIYCIYFIILTILLCQIHQKVF